MDLKSKEQPKYKQRLARCKKKYDDFKKDVEKKEKHASLKLPNRLRCTRAGPYAKNGYFHIAGKAARLQVYDLPASVLESRLVAAGVNPRKKGTTRAQQAQEYTFGFRPNGTGNNFLTSNRPYQSQAHHLVPDEALGPALFSDEQWAQLLKLPYDLNHGENIMLLPTSEKYCPIHSLPKHNGSHPDYNAMVKLDISKLKDYLQNTNCKNPEAPPLAILNDLVKFQGDYWDLLKSHGSVASVNEVAQNQMRQTANSDV
jgi:A nuclease family of the HNH/ENDO VII superfamily with conserved AHH